MAFVMHAIGFSWREAGAVPGRRPPPANEHRARSKAAKRRARSKAARRGDSGRAGDAVSTSPGTLRDKGFSWGVAPYLHIEVFQVVADLMADRRP